MSKVEATFLGREIYLTTTDAYAINVGIDVLKFLDSQDTFSLKDTGWKSGFGLKVAEWHPIIDSRNLAAEVETDGNEFRIRLTRGTQNDFSSLYNLILGFLNDAQSSADA